MLFAQSLTWDRAHALWDLGRCLGRGSHSRGKNLDDAAEACGHVVTCALDGLPALAMDEEGRVFAINLAGGSYVVRIGRVSDGRFREAEWAL